MPRVLVPTEEGTARATVEIEESTAQAMAQAMVGIEESTGHVTEYPMLEKQKGCQ